MILPAAIFLIILGVVLYLLTVGALHTIGLVLLVVGVIWLAVELLLSARRRP